MRGVSRAEVLHWVVYNGDRAGGGREDAWVTLKLGSVRGLH